MRLLITGAWKEAEKYIPLIEKQGHSVVFMQQEQGRLPCDPSWVEGVVCNGLFLHHEIKDFTDLKYIQLTSAGLDRVPVEYIREHKIALNNALGVYNVPMAEFAVCGVLQILKKALFFRENQNRHLWEKHRGLSELFGKRVLVIGCGSVGTECAKRFSAFGCEVFGVDIKPADDPRFKKIFGLKELGKEVSSADIIILTLPLNGQTEGLFDKKLLNSIKPGGVIVNISRGKVIDTGALTDALASRDLYAVLDVFEDEPLPAESPLWDMKNVIITPHNSFVGDGNAERLSKCILSGLLLNNREVI